MNYNTNISYCEDDTTYVLRYHEESRCAIEVSNRPELGEDHIQVVLHKIDANGNVEDSTVWPDVTTLSLQLLFSLPAAMEDWIGAHTVDQVSTAVVRRMISYKRMCMQAVGVLMPDCVKSAKR